MADETSFHDVLRELWESEYRRGSPELADIIEFADSEAWC
jgi:hypothetical protein